MVHGKITDSYLPGDLHGRVEAAILACTPALAAPFIPPEEVEAELGLRLACAPIADCIGNLTARFPDGPTYFVIVRASAPTAMVAAFGDFQCLVFADALHIYFSILMSELLESKPLCAFLQDGDEPHDDEAESTLTRAEALQALLGRTGKTSPEAASRTATIGYFLMYFLAAHELGHHALGHLGDTHRTHGRMGEADTDTAIDKLVESRALEWEADGFGAMAAVWQALALREQGHAAWSEQIKDQPACVRVFMTGAYVLFSIMDLASPSTRPPESRTHPAPMVRVGLAALMLTVALEVLGIIPGDVVQEETRRSIKAVEVALNTTAGGMMDRAEAEAVGNEAFAAVDPLYAALTAVKPDFDRSRLQGYIWARPFD